MGLLDKTTCVPITVDPNKVVSQTFTLDGDTTRAIKLQINGGDCPDAFRNGCFCFLIEVYKQPTIGTDTLTEDPPPPPPPFNVLVAFKFWRCSQLPTDTIVIPICETVCGPVAYCIKIHVSECAPGRCSDSVAL
ncbi:hypothetical protein EDD73_101166 [Heliophilum fasciatum]|uniref:Uncharacterized protein n=1 Tax=Heliophilum fasciatum TaxID=35700 RepID=A0A4R2RZH5_9FIRM|nr:hypothetical protein [Heliophilum fasciatum]TCP68998.1 hypothetical protein EDD73_101166 [Heliophilum fasciatum]